MSDSEGRISYVQFLQAVHDEPTLAPSASRLSAKSQGNSRRAERAEKTATEALSPEAAEDLLRKHVQAQFGTLAKVCCSQK